MKSIINTSGKRSMVLTTLAVAALASGLVFGCDEKKPTTVSSAATSAGKAMGDAGKAMSGAVGDAAKGAGEMAKGAGDAVAGGFGKIKAEGTKWVSETVEKQWPEAKRSLETMAAKVGDIKDSATQTKAQGLVSDLQARVPQVEGLVSRLKTAGEGDYSRLMSEAKSMWDTFVSKLGELKKLIPN